MENSNILLQFYSFHDCEKTPKKVHCIKYIEDTPDIKYPCLILMRYNNWNDYSYFTHFETFYVASKDADIACLETVKIIQTHMKTKSTILPDNFNSLPKDVFFSRGTLKFYDELQALGAIKNQILSALNDIHYHGYNKDDISKANDKKLLDAYEVSLFRDNFYELSSSSEYSKDSLGMLDKIGGCLTSSNKLDDADQQVIMKLLYGSIITVLESYLGDAFKYHVVNNKNYFYSFLKNYDFPKGDKKYKLKELGLHGNKIGEFIETKVKEMMNNIIFHKVPLVIELYSDILNINLPMTLIDFQEAIQRRHDIFHRNGKNVAGVDLVIEYYEILKIISDVKRFISETECILKAQLE